MRKAVGPGYPILVRIAANYVVSGGNDSREAGALPEPVRGMSLITRWTILQGVRRCGLQTIVIGTVGQVVSDGAALAVGEREQPIRADTIVLATGVTPRNSLYEELRGRVEELHLVGDAMHEGFGVGMQL